MPLRIAIIEDEPATARHLASMLTNIEPGLDIIATLGGVEEAVRWLTKNANACELIFMDIRLSDGLSFDIFSKVKFDTPVIFVTAYNEYALQAFKANGIDYILKPIDEDELVQAIEKFKKLRTGDSDRNNFSNLLKVAEHIRQGTGAFKQSFLVHYKDKLVPLTATDIAWFYTAYEIVYAETTDNRKYTVDYTMEQLEQQLDPAQFFRASRQFIVNRKAIREVDFYFNGRLALAVHPAPQDKIIISKARVPAFKEWMNI
jgi:two-component system, LytTR family, response regulator LytT